MKKLFLLTILVIVFFSCTQEDNLLLDETSEEIVDSKTEEIKYHIYYATWDEWGRVSKGCSGFGLCITQSCWWCCTNSNEVIVDCETGVPEINSGVAEIDISTGIGYMTIKLDPNVAEHFDAIRDQSSLLIDEDIAGEHFEIQSGNYRFDSNVGDNGGYLVDVIEN